MNRINHNNEEPNRTYNIQPYTHRAYPLNADVRHTYDTRNEPENVHLRDYLHVVLKRKWIVLAFFVSVVVTTVILSLLITPVYQSTTTINIDSHNPNALTSPGQNSSDTGQGLFATQNELLKSRTLAEKVVKKLALEKNDRFLPVQDKLSKVMDMVQYPVRKASSALISLISPKVEPKASTVPADISSTNPEVPPYLSSALTSRLDVRPVKDSQLVKITFEANDPMISMSVTNAVADAFIEYDLESRIDANKRAQTFLEKQIADLKQKTAEAESNLNQYSKKNEIVFIDSGKGSVLSQKLTEINSSLSAATAERFQKESLYNQIKESGSTIPAVLTNGLIQNLMNQHAGLEAEYANLSRTFTPDFPKMKNLKSQIDSVNSRIESEKSRITQSLQADYFTALKKEKYLKNSFDALQGKVLDFQERAVQYESLKREIDANKGLHNNLLQKLNEVGIAVLSKASRIQIVDKAIFPTHPSKPNIPRNFLLSIIFGLFGGIGLAFFVDYFDNTVKDMQEIEKNVRLPSLGIIPLQDNVPADARPMLVSSLTTNQVSEAFRSIGTFLLLSSNEKPPQTILITSPGGGEGKTTICVNIALALTEAIGNGIIIDADLRKPKMHSLFKLDNKAGLSNYLSGNIDFDSNDGKLMQPTSVKGISVITAGPTPPNPSELLYSARMKDLLDALQTMYSFVIIDAPPVMGMPDSILMSSLVDGTVLVVRAGHTQKNALSETKKVFNGINSKLLGVVLNGVKKNDMKYDYYSSYFSSYFNK